MCLHGWIDGWLRCLFGVGQLACTNKQTPTLGLGKKAVGFGCDGWHGMAWHGMAWSRGLELISIVLFVGVDMGKAGHVIRTCSLVRNWGYPVEKLCTCLHADYPSIYPNIHSSINVGRWGASAAMT